MPSSLTKQGHCLWKPLALTAHLSAGVLQGYTAGAVASPLGYVAASLSGQEGEALRQVTVSFHNRLWGWEGPGATLSLLYELIPLPVQSTGMLHAWYWLCSGGYQLYPPASWIEEFWATLPAEVVTNPSCQMGWETFSTACRLLFSSMLGVGTLGSRVSKTP